MDNTFFHLRYYWRAADFEEIESNLIWVPTTSYDVMCVDPYFSIFQLQVASTAGCALKMLAVCVLCVLIITV